MLKMTGRSTRDVFLNVEKHNFNNPLTHIQININTRKNERFDGVRDGAEKLAFDEIFTLIKARLIDETTEMFNHRKSMTLRLGVKFEVGKLELDPFDDEEEDEKKEKKKSYIKGITPLIWSTKYKVCTKSNLNLSLIHI